MKKHLLAAAAALTLVAGFAAAPSLAQSTPPFPNGGSFRHDAVPPPAAERAHPAPERHHVEYHRRYHRHRHVEADAGQVERCKAHYRSYREHDHSYLGYDGKRHTCRL